MIEPPPAGRTPAEQTFIAELSALCPGLDYWEHDGADGSPWLMVSHDFVVGNCIHDTLRLDYDGHGVLGGWSPAFLNWDDGVKAADAGIDTSGPDGLMAEGAPAELARAAAAWFHRHVAAWGDSDRAKRWNRRA